MQPSPLVGPGEASKLNGLVEGSLAQGMGYSMMSGEGQQLQKHVPTILHTSSEDTHYPATELSKPVPSSRGWQSARHCDYPQHLAFRFDGEVFLEQIQLLSNETKVPTRVDIYVSTPTPAESRERLFPQYEKTAFRRLGYVAFHDNKEGQYKCGELKSVRVGCPVLYVQLVIWEPFETPLNFHAQVGLSAVTCVGKLLSPYVVVGSTGGGAFGGAAGRFQGNIPHVANPSYGPGSYSNASVLYPDASQLRLNAASTPLERLQMDLAYDQAIITKVKDLTILKNRASAEENFELARQIKAQIDALYPLGMEIQQLEIRKRKAMLEEDFQLAHILKGDIDELRAKAAAYKVTGSSSSPNKSSGGSGAPMTLNLPSNYAPGVYGSGAAYLQQGPPLQQQFPANTSINSGAPLAMSPGALGQPDPQLNRRGGSGSDRGNGTPLGGYSSRDEQHHPLHQGGQRTTPPPALNSLDHNNAHDNNSRGGAPPANFDDMPVGGGQGGNPFGGVPPRTPPQRQQQQHSYDETPVGGGGGGGGYGGGQAPEDQFDGYRAGAPPPVATNPFDEVPAVASGIMSPSGGIGGGGGGGAASSSVKPLDQSKLVNQNDMQAYDQIMSRIINEKAPGQNAPEIIASNNTLIGLDKMQGAFGVYLSSALFSKRHQLREGGSRALAEKGDDVLQHVSAQELLNAVMVFLGNRGAGLADPVSSVFFANAELFYKAVMGQFQGDASVAFKEHGIPALQLLVDRLGDTNVRIASSAKDLLLSASRSAGYGIDAVASRTLDKKSKSYRAVVDRVEVVMGILQTTPNQQELQRASSMEVDNICKKLVIPGLQHAHNEAREKSLELVVLLHDKYGAAALEPHLSKLKPSQRKVVDERLAGGPAATGLTGEEGSKNTRLRQKLSQAKTDDERYAHYPSPYDAPPGSGANAIEIVGGGFGDNVPVEDGPRASSTNYNTAGGGLGGGYASPSPKNPGASPTPTTGGNGPGNLPTRRKPPPPIPGACQFCQLKDDSFEKHEELVQHFMSECPMLCTCPLCKLPVEIREVHWHLTHDCEHRKKLKQCPRCLEAVKETEYDAHVAAKNCALHNPETQVCPLCHETMPAGDAFWEVHIMTPPYCSKNPRTAGAN